MNQKVVLFALSIICVVCSGCRPKNINITQDDSNTKELAITIGSHIKATNEINKNTLPAGYELHFSTGKQTRLERYRYEFGEPSGNMIHYEELDGLEIYSISQQSIYDTHTSNLQEIIWGSNTSIEQIYTIMQKRSPKLKTYCQLEIDNNEDGSTTAIIGFGSKTQKLLRFLTGSHLDEVVSICNHGAIYCENNTKHSECEYRYNFKNGGGWSDIVIGSLRKLQ